MTDALTAQQCLERARMHEQLAATTADASARMMHQAMAAEFRRRAELGSIEIMPRPVNRPMGEMARLTG